MIRLAVHGARGRMGGRICSLARSDDRFEIVAEIDRDDASRRALREDFSCDVIVDFSTPQGTEQAMRIAVENGAALLVGTTGLSRRIVDSLGDASRSVAVMIAPNTSPGIAVLKHIAVRAAGLLGGDFDVDIIETHHAAKRDAPSGTALRLAEEMREIAAVEIGPQRIHSIRAGDVIGEHVVQFTGRGEIIKISHKVVSRDIFASGALQAAAYLAGRAPGRYDIEDALGLAP